MPVRKKTRAELVGEQLNPFSDSADAAFHEEAPTVEAYDAEDDAKAAKRPRAKRGEQKLRKRGPLDSSLSSGKYAAVPRGADGDDADAIDDGADFDVRGAEASLDDMFGMLDEDGAEQTAGIKTQAQLESYLENRAKATRRPTGLAGKRSRGGAGDDDDDEDAGPAKDYSHLDAGDADVMMQIDELRRRNLNISTSGGAPSSGADADDTQASMEREVEHARKCVSLSAQLLAFRLKLQPAVSAAVRMPQYYSLGDFEEQSSKLGAATEELRTAARKMTKSLFSVAGIPVVKSTSSDKLWASLSVHHKAVMSAVDDGVKRWGHRAQVSSDPKLQAVNRPLLEQIRGVISGRQRLLHRAQRNRGHAHIFGHPHHFDKTAADRAVAIADGDEDREIFDDCDFVKDLAVRQGGAAAKSVDRLMPEDKLKAEAKKGHHRKTKGRTVNYDPRPKLVGFMVTRPYEDDGRYDALLTSVFGGQQQQQDGTQ
jgi:protein AATF/BFR2